MGTRGCSGPAGAAASPCFSAGPPGASTSEATPRPLSLPGLDPSPLGSHPTHPAQEVNMAEASLLHPLCPFPTCQPAARTVPTGVTPCLGAHTTSGSTGATVWPPQAHESPFLPPDHACTPRACAGGRRGPGESRVPARPAVTPAGRWPGCGRKQGGSCSLQFPHPRAPVPSPRSSALTPSAPPAPASPAQTPAFWLRRCWNRKGHGARGTRPGSAAGLQTEGL